VSTDDDDNLKDHSYDGIREYDNQLPRWWLWTFILTVIFGLGYWLYYHVYEIGVPSTVEYQQIIEAQQLTQSRQSVGAVESADVAQIRAWQKDAAVLQRAAQLFTQNCAACHGVNGEGVIGPNLTDRYWLHGGTPDAIFHAITDGVPDKGMLAWKSILSTEQRAQLVAYILSLANSNPPNAKAPQGDAVTP